MENADLIRNRIAALERALFVLRLDDTTSRVTGFGAPSRNQVEHLRRLDDPDDHTEDNLDWLDLRYIDNGEDDDDSEDDLGGPGVTIKSLVVALLANKTLDEDSVTSGAA